MIEEGEQPVVKAKAVEQGARLRMGPKLRPGPDLEQFLERAYPARQRDKAIRQIRHQRLALMHRAYNAQLGQPAMRSEEHTSELQSLMRISYAVSCLKKKN